MEQNYLNAFSGAVKAAVCPHLGYNKEGKVKNPMTGQKLEVKPLKDIIYSQLDIPSSRKKGESGCVFPFSYDRMYSVNEIDFQSSGVVFIDLDHIDKEDLEKITSNFQLLCDIMPDLLSLHLSYSGNGLHLYFLSPVLNKDEYCKRVIVNCMRLDKAFSKYLNINLDKSVFDSHQVSIKQRFFLNRPKDSKIHFNDTAFSIIGDEETQKRIINQHIGDYPTLVGKWKSLTYTQKDSPQSTDIDFSNKAISPNSNRPPHLSHMDRMLLFNSLRVVFNDDRSKVLAAHAQCMNRMQYSSDNNTQLKDAIAEPMKNNWFKYKDPHISMRLLTLFYDIDEIKTIEQSEDVEQRNYELNEEELSLLAKYI